MAYTIDPHYQGGNRERSMSGALVILWKSQMTSSLQLKTCSRQACCGGCLLFRNKSIISRLYIDANYIESSFINKYPNLLESMAEKLKKQNKTNKSPLPTRIFCVSLKLRFWT